MERTRQNPARQVEPEDVADVAMAPTGGPALMELLETLRGPAVMKSDVDALQAALARPPEGDETPRQRADLLLALIDDAQLRDYTGQDGRTVRVTAVQALVGLGYPYALEVPPEALQDTPGASSEEEGGEYRVPWGSITIALINVLVQAVPAVFLLFIIENWNHGGERIGLASIGAAIIATPSLLAILGGAWQVRWLQLTGVVLMALGCLLMGVGSLMALSAGAFGLLMLIPTGLQAFSTWQLSQPWSSAPEPDGGS